MLYLLIKWEQGSIFRRASPRSSSRSALGTDCSLPRRQCSTRQIEIGQRQQGNDLGGVLGQASITHLAIAPQVFDDPKGMFNPGSDPVALLVERAIGTRQLPASAGFTKPPPLHTIRFGVCFAFGPGIGFSAIDDLFLAV